MLKQLMKSAEWDDAVRYRIGCDCGAPEHDLDIWAEKEKDGLWGTIMFSQTTHTRYWRTYFDHDSWFYWLNDPINRIMIAGKVLLTGYVETNADFVLSKDNVQALRTALDAIEEKFE